MDLMQEVITCEKRRILLVNADVSTRKSLEYILADQGCEIVKARTGKEALDKAKEIDFDLAILDIQLPDMDGVTLIERLLTMNSHLAVLILIGCASAHFMVQALQRGIAGFITKPVSTGEPLVLARKIFAAQQADEKRQPAWNPGSYMLESLWDSKEQYRNVIECISEGVILTDEQGLVIEWNKGVERITGLERFEVLAKAIWDVLYRLLPEEERAATNYNDYRMRIMNAYKTGEAPWLKHSAELLIQRDDGTKLTMQMMSFVTRTDKGIRIGSSVKDTTEFKQFEQALRISKAQTDRIDHIFRSLCSAARAMQRAQTANEVYQILCDGVKSLGYQAAVLTITEDGKNLEANCTTLISSQPVEYKSQADYFLLEQEGFLQDILNQGEPAFIDPGTLSIENKIPGLVHPTLGWLLTAISVEKAIFIPLTVNGKVLGLAIVIGASLTQADIPTLVTLTDQVSGAVENIHLIARIKTAYERQSYLSHRLVRAQEDERRRAARELHDEFGQALTGLNYKLEEIRRRSVQAEVSQNTTEALSMLWELMIHLDKLQLDLRPPALDDLGLLPALAAHLTRFSEHTHVVVDFKHAGLGTRRFPAETEMTAFRVVQEALTNVARHARVQQVKVRVKTAGKVLRIQVEDQGVGFDVQTALSSRTAMGLNGMIERVELVNGKLVVESRPGEGTCVIARLPLPHGA